MAGVVPFPVPVPPVIILAATEDGPPKSTKTSCLIFCCHIDLPASCFLRSASMWSCCCFITASSPETSCWMKQLVLLVLVVVVVRVLMSWSSLLRRRVKLVMVSIVLSGLLRCRMFGFGVFLAVVLLVAVLVVMMRIPLPLLSQLFDLQSLRGFENLFILFVSR
jgi:hypothetical protein